MVFLVEKDGRVRCLLRSKGWEMGNAPCVGPIVQPVTRAPVRLCFLLATGNLLPARQA